MAERKISLPMTKGEFKVSGLATGTNKGDKFFENKLTKSKSQMNLLNFGVETKKDSTVYISLNGLVKDEVVFYKKAEKKGEKGQTKKIKWAERYKFAEEGYKLIGINIGVIKTVNDKGQQVNDNKMLAEFDACKQIAENLKDGQSVFVRGNIDFSSFKNDKGEVRRNIKFVPSQVSLAKDVDFESEDFKEVNSFKQTIIFTGIEMDDSDPSDKKARVQAKIVNYNTIEDTELIIRDSKLYMTFKKNLKPYQSIEVWGTIFNKVETSEEEETDTWGEANSFDTVKKSFIRELVITGANPSSIDKETYSEKEIEKAIRALKEFGDEPTGKSSGDSWGDENIDNTTSEDDEW